MRKYDLIKNISSKNVVPRIKNIVKIITDWPKKRLKCRGPIRRFRFLDLTTRDQTIKSYLNAP